jgi:4'-phosphopantetheinyl transferase
LPGSGVVHIWFIKTDLRDFKELPLDRLFDQGSQRSECLPPFADSSGSAAHMILRELLSRYLRKARHEIHFRREPDGKWTLDEPSGPAVYFNMARADDAIAFAFACDRAVGIDLERIQAHPYARAVVDVYFSPQERTLLSPAADSEFDIRFLETWTRKEAYVKAVGCGLGRVDLPTVEFSPQPDGVAVLNDWAVRNLRLDPDYVAAVAAKGTDWEPTVLKAFRKSLQSLSDIESLYCPNL